MGKNHEWEDRNGLIHACGGARMIQTDPNTYCVWTLCGRDVPAGESYKAGEESVTCKECIASLSPACVAGDDVRTEDDRQQPAITLRDQFALAALQGMLAAGSGASDYDLAVYAYRAADAMLAAREQSDG